MARALYDGLLAEIYDDYTDADARDDLVLWRRLCADCDGAALELASGTGRMLLPLLAEGHTVEGLDNSADITAAVEVLTGVEASALPRYMGATFVREIARSAFEAGGVDFSVSIGMQVGEIHASDWIYAAAFAANSDGVYLAAYSGRVVLVDEKGKGVRVYDIGSVPRRIIDTGDYLYLLTDTRLYVLHDDALHALVDTSDGGDLVVAQTSFGLLEKKRLRWFREDGRYLGSILSKDPIRRVYSADEGMIVETRQRRVLVQGVPGWWQ